MFSEAQLRVPAWMPPSVLRDFDFIAQLDDRSPVILGVDKLTRDEVVIKKASESEVSHHRDLKHENICPIVRVYEENQIRILVLERLTTDLLTHLNNLRWPSEALAKQVARQVVAGLAYLHSQCICHRDIKLENCGVKLQNGQVVAVKIFDFGDSELLLESGTTRGVRGTKPYMAPEVLAGQEYSFPADLWSLGVGLYLLLVKAYPFGCPGQEDVDRISQGCYAWPDEPWRSISPMARSFVDDLLQVDPAVRMTAGKAQGHAWLAKPGKIEQNPASDALDALQVFVSSPWPVPVAGEDRDASG